MSDDWNKLKHLVDLSAENARLKAEVERLTNCQSEADRLKAEAEMLRASSFVTAVPVEEYEKLKAEVERLRKAVKIADGAVDCVIKVHDYGFTVSTSYVESLKRDWNAAKEGKPSEQKSPSFIEDLGNGVEKHDLLFRYPSKETPPHA